MGSARNNFVFERARKIGGESEMETQHFADLEV